ncbi:MAG: chemotaxis protein CheX [Planctomycetota bacterium]
MKSTAPSMHAFKVEYLQPFIDSLHNLFVTHLSMTLEVGKPILNQDGRPAFEYCGVIGFSGAVAGRAVVSFPAEVAIELVKAYLGMDEVPEEVITDCVGELANVIVGRAKSALEQYQIAITPPTVVFGSNFRLSDQSGATCISIPCTSGIGPVQLEVSFHDAG